MRQWNGPVPLALISSASLRYALMLTAAAILAAWVVYRLLLRGQR